VPMRVQLFALAAVALLAASCGSEPSSAASGGGGGPDVSIAAPDDGASLSVPFTVEVSSSEELGPTDTGAHHVHLFFDGNEDEYEVVESDSIEIDDLDSGDHTIGVSLRNADHSAAGAEAEISVTVTGGGGGGTDDSDQPADDAYDY
jgi:hypothetical protein